MSIGACTAAILFGPRRAWVWFRRPWGRGTCALVGTRIDIEGLANLQQGPAVFIANHQSLIDAVLLPAILPQTTCLVAKKELEHIPFLGWMLAAGGAMMVDRKDPVRAVESIREGLKKLPAGWSVFVFPEGTRSEDGSLRNFKKGAFHIAIASGLPVIPIGLEGAIDVVPKTGLLLRPATVFVTVGAPIPTTRWSTATLEEHVHESHAAVAACVQRSADRQRAADVQNGMPERCVVH